MDFRDNKLIMYNFFRYVINYLLNFIIFAISLGQTRLAHAKAAA